MSITSNNPLNSALINPALIGKPGAQAPTPNNPEGYMPAGLRPRFAEMLKGWTPPPQLVSPAPPPALTSHSSDGAKPANGLTSPSAPARNAGSPNAQTEAAQLAKPKGNEAAKPASNTPAPAARERQNERIDGKTRTAEARKPGQGNAPRDAVGRNSVDDKGDPSAQATRRKKSTADTDTDLPADGMAFKALTPALAKTDLSASDAVQAKLLDAATAAAPSALPDSATAAAAALTASALSDVTAAAQAVTQGKGNSTTTSVQADDGAAKDSTKAESLDSLMPSVAQAVFGNSDKTKDSSKDSAKTGDNSVAGQTPGLALAALRSTEASEPSVAGAASGKVGTEGLQKASGEAGMMESSAGRGDKAGNAPSGPSFSTLLHAASALPGANFTAGPGASALTSPSVPLAVQTPVMDPGFAPEMAARLSVLASDGVQKAELHLNPAEMGPVSVQIAVDGQQAQVQFHAQHEATRAVLERSLPELAAALRDAGMTLSGGGVFQQARDGQGSGNGRGEASNGSTAQNSLGTADNGPLSSVLGASTINSARRVQRGVLDTYA